MPYLPAAGDSVQTVKIKLEGLKREAAIIRNQHAKYVNGTAQGQQPTSQAAPNSVQIDGQNYVKNSAGAWVRQ